MDLLLGGGGLADHGLACEISARLTSSASFCACFFWKRCLNSATSSGVGMHTVFVILVTKRAPVIHAKSIITYACPNIGAFSGGTPKVSCRTLMKGCVTRGTKWASVGMIEGSEAKMAPSQRAAVMSTFSHWKKGTPKARATPATNKAAKAMPVVFS